MIQKLTMQINEKQEKLAKEWLKNHNCGPIFLKDVVNPFPCSYIYTDTPIGTIVEVRCNKCGQIHDITDYDTW